VADSLRIAGQIELLGGGNGVESDLPTCLGAVFTLDPGYDGGAPQPTTDEVASLILDGERPYGTRASNRTITLPVSVTAPDRDTLAGALETLLQIIDAETWTLTWTRDGGLPLVFDCFRASPSKPTYDLIAAAQLHAAIEITFPALPYGRSDTAVQVTFASPLAGTTPPPSPVTLDSFTTVAGAQWAQSTATIAGPFSAKWDPSIAPANNSTGQGLPAVYSAAVSPVADIWAGFGSAYWYFTHQAPVTFSVKLTDSAGKTVTFGTTQSVITSQDPASPSWTQITVSVPQGAAFDYTHVAAYQITMTNSSGGGGFFGGGGGPGLTYTDAYLALVTANALSAAPVASVRGAVYTLFGVEGTSHAPLSLQFSQATPTTPFSTLLAYRPDPGTPQSLNPLVPVGSGSDVPNGATHYPVASLISGVNASFAGTYSVIGVAQSFAGSASTARTVTANIFQYEYSGGPSTSVPVSRSITPSTDARNGMFWLDSVTLPIKALAPDNTDALFDITVTSGNTSDRFLDFILVSTQGQLVWVNTASTNYVLYSLDEAGTDTDLGYALGTSSTRGRAVSVMGDTIVSGGQLTADPGNVNLLVYAKEGAPALTAFYFPRYYLDRTG
jgi:hypothetical protein